MITGICTVCAAIGASLLNDWLFTNREKKVARSVAKAIMYSLYAEIKIGIDVLSNYIATPKPMGLMPTKGWDTYWPKFTTGMIYAVVNSTKGKKSTAGFPPYEFLTHLKNYYSYICGNVNEAIGKNAALPPTANNQYLQPAKQVLLMVDEIVKSIA